jgi:hypothetical protein
VNGNHKGNFTVMAREILTGTWVVVESGLDKVDAMSLMVRLSTRSLKIKARVVSGKVGCK